MKTIVTVAKSAPGLPRKSEGDTIELADEGDEAKTLISAQDYRLLWGTDAGFGLADTCGYRLGLVKNANWTGNAH